MTKRQLKRKAKALQRRAKRQWRHLSVPRRTTVIAGAVVELTLFALAQIDIGRREADEIRGSKLMWRLVSLVSFIGPILYFTFGRITPEPARGTMERTAIVA